MKTFLSVSNMGCFQENARKALDVLWERRQRGSDLVGTVINIHNEEWVRRGETTVARCLRLRHADLT